jgi:hypothetical protein
VNAGMAIDGTYIGYCNERLKEQYVLMQCAEFGCWHMVRVSLNPEAVRLRAACRRVVCECHGPKP